MRIRKISNDKIAVQLTDTDLEYFAPDLKEKTPQAADLHKFLFDVMELVKSETGFDPYNGGQVVVEATASPGGMSLIISKIRTKKTMTREEFARVKKINVKECGIKSEIKPKKKMNKYSTYIFENFSDFENAMINVTVTDFINAGLYRKKDGYALITNSDMAKTDHNRLSEYALKSMKNDIFAYGIFETWSKVASGETLSELVGNLRKMN